MRSILRVTLALALVVLAACEAERRFTAPVDSPAFGVGAGRTASNPDMAGIARFLAGAPPGVGRGAQVAVAVIGPRGGSVRLGDYEIVVPPGAVTAPIRFSIRLPPDAAARRHAFAVFSPHGRTFHVPVLLRLPHANTDAVPGSPAVWWSGNEWVELETEHLDDGRIETPVSHFSTYGSWRGITLAGG
jgi:hypothetical protein